MSDQLQITPDEWGWTLLIHKPTQARQLMPNSDTREHNHEGPCWCQPWVDCTGLLVHNSHDGRERYEQGAARPH